MKTYFLAILGLICSIAWGSDQPVKQRNIIVNDITLNPAQIQALDQFSCTYVPDGNYWLNLNTGLWGYRGGVPQGYITGSCLTRRPNLSERGLLYNPHEYFFQGDSNVGTDSTGPRVIENMPGESEIEN